MLILRIGPESSIKIVINKLDPEIKRSFLMAVSYKAPILGFKDERIPK